MVIDTKTTSTVKLKKNLIIKNIYKFLKFYYREVKVITIEILENEVYLYIDNRHVLSNQSIVELQHSVKKYINHEFSLDISKINIINL